MKVTELSYCLRKKNCGWFSVVTHWVNHQGTLEVISKSIFWLTTIKIQRSFFKDLTATVDSVLSKQTWAILRIKEAADSEVPDLTQWWGALSVYFAYLCHLRLVQSRTPRRPSSALSTPLSPLRVTKKRLNTSLRRPGRSVICRGSTMSTAWGWEGGLWYYMGHTERQSLLNLQKLSTSTSLLKHPPPPPKRHIFPANIRPRGD